MRRLIPSLLILALLFTGCGCGQVRSLTEAAPIQQPSGTTEIPDDFNTVTLRQFLSGGGPENRVYSPINVYLALGALAEVTGGESREQILTLLGELDMDSLRIKVGELWSLAVWEQEQLKCELAASLWLNQELSYDAQVLSDLAEAHHTSAFQGVMGSDEYDARFRKWINEHTGGLLETKAEQLQFDALTALALASTIYLEANWSDRFSEKATQERIFHAPDGDVSCRFMHCSDDMDYYMGDGWGAISLGMNGARMWLFLPDYTSSVDDLLASGAVGALTSDAAAAERCMVNVAMPKFDVDSKVDLQAGLQELGVTDVFAQARADFSPLLGEEAVAWVGKIEHAARVSVDEEGVVAAAYTVIEAPGAAMPPEREIDFVLDRPFVFLITGRENTPLFAGVVNHP